MSYTALIVEDEYLAAEELRKMLAAHPEVEVLGIAETLPAAIEQIQGLKPQ